MLKNALYTKNAYEVQGIAIGHRVYYSTKPLHRFNGLNVFGQVWIPDRGRIFQMGPLLCDVQGSKCTGIRIFIKLTVQ